MRWLLRDYHDDDFDAVLRLWDATAVAQQSVFAVSECIGALRSRQPAVVAVHGGQVVGAALASVSGDRAWLLRLAVHSGWRGQGLASALLVELERRLAESHVRRISYVLTEPEMIADGLANAGYVRRPAVAYFEKVESLGAGEGAVLERLGGRVLPPRLWDQLAGMEREKQLIERRIISPLAQPERAQRHGVVPPRAVVLFGPPGTGKTTFAKGVASRLGWPFVELFPSRLATDSPGLAAALRETFAQLAELERVVVFIDEVEEIAFARGNGALSPAHAVTNELLKLIPGFREHDTRLLVCATNSIGDLDPALLRPGRFDYVIPVGPPDPVARRAIWERYAGSTEVNLERLVDASDAFTPAEIEHAARVAAQASFERDLLDEAAGSTEGPTTSDFLAAISQVRPSVTPEHRAGFDRDIEHFARV